MKVILILCVMSLLVSVSGCDSGAGNTAPITLSSENSLSITDDFAGNHNVWQPQSGEWIFSGGSVRQTSTTHHFPLLLRMDKQFGDLDIRVEFKPLSGKVDASGGLVFRAQDKGNYYIVRANSLENNFRLYTFKNGHRRQIASARVEPPELGGKHWIRVVAKGDHIQSYLDGRLYLDHHDKSFAKGYVGLWTKADSVTDFDNLEMRATD